jgi:hypothetical protein
MDWNVIIPFLSNLSFFKAIFGLSNRFEPFKFSKFPIPVISKAEGFASTNLPSLS